MSVVEYDGRMVVVDCRRALPDGRDARHRPRAARLRAICSSARAIEAIVITHGHEDHLGALAVGASRARRVPLPVVYGRRLTVAMAKSKLDEHKLRDAGQAARAGQEIGRPIRDRARPHDPLDSRRCRRRPTTSLGTVLFTGDYRFDQTPVDGRPADIAGSPASPTTGCCCSAGTRRTPTAPATRSRSPRSVRGWAGLRALQGRIIVTSFASNIHRVQQVDQRRRGARPPRRAARPLDGPQRQDRPLARAHRDAARDAGRASRHGRCPTSSS